MTDHLYAWQGNDSRGLRVNGELHAKNKAEISQRLRLQRIRATRIQRQFKFKTWGLTTHNRQVSKVDITRITRQLATLIHAGVPLLQAFDILHKGETQITLKNLICEVHTRVESGLALSEALRQHPEFDALFCNLVAVGEATGMLDTLLERLAQHREKAEALRTTLQTALLYPCAVLTIAFIVLTVILLFVVPAFESIFSSFGAELPWLTQGVIAASQWVQQNGLIAISTIWGCLWCLTRQVRQRDSWKRQLYDWLLRTPIAGRLIRHACTARWTRTMSTLFFSGVPLTEALDSVQDVTGNAVFRTATLNIKQQLIQGVSLSQAIETHTHLFPAMVVQMCAIGEESGALDHMLAKTAEYYEQDVDRTVARLSTLLEPLIMVVLGLLIGGLVMALYLPIFQLGQVV